MIPIYRPEGTYAPDRAKHALILFIEPKWDGHWLRVHNLEGEPCAHGHDVSTSTGRATYLPSDLVKRFAAEYSLPPQTILEGELLWPGHPASEVITAIKKRPDELVLKPFTSPLWAGEDLQYALYSVAQKKVGFAVPNFKYLGDPPTLEYMLDLHKRMWPRAEGLVVKQYWYANWWKVKPVKTADLRVKGFLTGTAGKWYGLPASMLLETSKGTDCGRCGNMSDVVHMEIPDHIGGVVEVAFDCLTRDGKLRFPRFVRWREDKECKELSEQV